jgi:hypothetical protein
VLKSRRGLLAAGLAVAVVGALGVVSTLNAGADQIPGTPDSTTAAPADTSATPADDTSAAVDGSATIDTSAQPPTNLPWGSRPRTVRKGRAGANSKALHAAGLDVASSDTSGDETPDAAFSPKGRTGKTSFLRSEKTDVAPQPAAAATTPAPAATVPDSGGREVDFSYGLARQVADVDGFYSSLTISKPALAKEDYHTLAELALESADSNQIVEIGWNVDRSVNGDEDPHLFVYHWINNKSTCYNACGFVQFSPNVKPGDTLNYGAIKKFGIQYFNGSWWVAFDSEWIGYFPEQLWNDQGVKFSKGGFQQVFGEVASSSTTPCATQMGLGLVPLPKIDPDTGLPTTKVDSSALVTSMGFLNGPPLAMEVKATNPSVYNVQSLNSKTFRYGGPTSQDPKYPNLTCSDSSATTQ